MKKSEGIWWTAPLQGCTWSTLNLMQMLTWRSSTGVMITMFTVVVQHANFCYITSNTKYRLGLCECHVLQLFNHKPTREAY